MKTKYIVFDLDDTLTYEIDFLKSAYTEIAIFLDEHNQEALFEIMFSKYEKGENVFDFLTQEYSKFSKDQLLHLYRNHFPNIALIEGAGDVLKEVKAKGYKLGLITDGRSVTQRNKLKALKIEDLFDRIIISEEFGSSKPDERNYTSFISSEIDEYFYIADNPKKDFVTPNRLGWTSVCLLEGGHNIHTQEFTFTTEYLPKLKIKNISELVDYL